MTVGVLVALQAAPFEPVVLAALGSDRTHVVRRCVDLADLLATAASGQADAAVVSAELAGLGRDVIDQLASDGVVVIGVADPADVSQTQTLERLGIAWVAFGGAAADLQAAVVELASQAASLPDVEPTPLVDAPPPRHRDGPERPSGRAAPRPSPGKVIAVWGPTGAPGRSVVALGLAAAIADLGSDALAVDADVYGGSMAQLTGVLDETSGLLAAARSANTGRLDVATLNGLCLQLGPGLRVLTGLPRADRWVEARPSLVADVLAMARRLSAHTVVDCGFSLEVDEEVMYDTRAPRRNGATLEAIQQADTVLVVGSADPVGLSRMVRAIDDVASAVPGCAPIAVVNRLRVSIGWSADDVAAMLRRTTAVTRVVCLPDDPPSCDRALVAGRTLIEAAPSGRLAHSLRALAADLAGLELPPPGRLARLRTRAGQGRNSSQSPVSV